MGKKPTIAYKESKETSLQYIPQSGLVYREKVLTATEKPVIVARSAELNPNQNGKPFIVRVPKPEYYTCQQSFPSESQDLFRCYQQHDIITPREYTEAKQYIKNMEKAITEAKNSCMK